MKTLFLITFFFCFANLAWGQEIYNVKYKIDSTAEKTLQETETEEEKLLRHIREVLNEKDGRTKIGSIKMGRFAVVFDNSTPIKGMDQIKPLIKEVKSANKTQTENITGKTSQVGNVEYNLKVSDSPNVKTLTAKVVYIDSVKIQIEEGLIEFIKVYANDGSTFYNKYAPIQLLTIENRFNDKLYNPRNGDFILLKNVIFFDTDRRFNFFPNNQTFTLVKGAQSQKILYANNGINSFVDFKIFSDLLALLGNEPNEILQLEASAKFYLHRKNAWGFSYLFYAFEPFFRFNRLDSKFDTITVANDGSINKTKLFRRNNFTTGVSLKALRLDWRPANSFEINFGYLYSSSNVVINQEETTGIFHTIYGEASIASNRLNNFGMELSGRYIQRKLNENKQFSNNSEWYGLGSFSGSIFYFPPGKSDDRIVLRFTNYLNWENRTLDYSSLQIGYRTSLNF